MSLDFSAIPLIDNHCHSLLRVQPTTLEEWKKFFSESYYAEIPRTHVEHTVFYQWAQRALGAFYDCDATAEAILAKRNAYTLAALTQKINAAANIGAWLVDYGFSTPDTYGHEELKTISGVRVEKVLRLEPLLEQLILHSENFDALHDAYGEGLKDVRAQGYVALKSILAYRVGLTLRAATREDARAEFSRLRERALSEGNVRVASKPFLDYFIPLAVASASAQNLPIQFHTGFGDPDQDLATSNPAYLRPLFEGEKYRGAKIILLHAAYPYTRTLGYLASVYPNVYADFGLAIPFATGEARQILRELLGLAPASKILYSSDAFHIPELYYLGAVLGRRALAAVLEEWIAEDVIHAPAAEKMGARILNENARQVYELG